MLNYFMPLLGDNGLIFSIDKVVLDYRIPYSKVRDALTRFVSHLPDQYDVNVKNYDSLKTGVFHANANIILSDGTSFFVGIGLNANKTLWDRCRLEFNPNKVAHHKAFLEVLEWLNHNSDFHRRAVKRFDLAIDIPVDRKCAFLVKDQRVYQERRHGQEWTEYLGAKSSTVGRCKLYNKTTEADLSYPLTRLEITLDPTTPYDKLHLPTVYYVSSPKVHIDKMPNLSDTQRYILGAYLNGYGNLDQLGRRTREKIESCLSHSCKQATISEADYGRILAQVSSYTIYPNDLRIPPPIELDQCPEWSLPF